LFAHVFARSSFEFFIEGHRMAFSALGGVPYGIRYDNLSTVVLRRRPEVQYNPRFLEFSRHYNLEIRLCNPGAATRKVGSNGPSEVSGNLFNTLERFGSLKALNQALHEWVEHKNQTVHRTTEKKPQRCFGRKTSEPCLKPLEQCPDPSPVKTTKTALMIFDTNSYSVPDYLVGKALSIHCTRIRS